MQQDCKRLEGRLFMAAEDFLQIKLQVLLLIPLIREKYLQLKDEEGSRELIENQAVEYIAALGYGQPDSIHIELNDEITVPVFQAYQRRKAARLYAFPSMHPTSPAHCICMDDWERDSIEIKNNPYIQIIAVVTGVN